MTGQRIGSRLALASLLVIGLGACLPVADDATAREKVLRAVQAGNIVAAEGFDIYRLPDNLAYASQGGEIVTYEDGDGLTIIIFDFRGLNHYTGWVYRSNGDPPTYLGSEPLKLDRVEGNWFRVDVG